MTTARFFKEGEFNKCVPSCSLQDMKQSTMSKLDTARSIAGVPFILNCAYRSQKWDIEKGRSGLGAHTTGNAVDIRCSSDRDRMLIVNSCIQAGFSRIGIAKTFVHADDSPSLNQDVIWLY